METESTLNALMKLGLSSQEAFVYVNSLKLGVAKASEIASKSGINREASYYVLRQLKEKGFVSEVIKSGIKHYSAVQPKRITEIIDEQKAVQKDALLEALPELEALQKVALTHPKIEFFEGIEGLNTTFSRILDREHQTIYAYVPEKIFSQLPNVISLQFRRKRKERKLKIKVITERTKYMLRLKNQDIQEYRETRFNDSIIKGSDALLYITDNSIFVIKANEKEKMGVCIKEEANAKMQRKIFEQVWSSCIK